MVDANPKLNYKGTMRKVEQPLAADKEVQLVDPVDE